MSIHDIRREVRRRRTFAIISHPDAGKTTLTEKLLLYSGLLRTAGMVGGRKGKSAASDWMGMEQERGISITASAMQFTYRNTMINVLDTPGHQDFSEDTYRTLAAADSVIMVIDAAKGVEEQTRKLFDACRLRNIPVMTFVNKMDVPSRDPFDLMAEVEEVLGLDASPRNWPIGSGRDFRGVVVRETQEILLYSRTGAAGTTRADCQRVPLSAADGHPLLDPAQLNELREEIALLDAAGNPWSRDAYLECRVTPVFFGSALINYGIEPLFDSFISCAPCPGARPATTEDAAAVHVDPAEAPFSAFVFKLQANMNRHHRDCVAFLRVNSGRFERGLRVRNQTTGKQFQMPAPHSLLADERSTLTDAYPGDVIGIINKGQFGIGDTITASGHFRFADLPNFQPEVFARVRPADLGKQKAFAKGLDQLVAEGTVQRLSECDGQDLRPILAVVGRLQFEVMAYRLEGEYNVAVTLDYLPYACSAWMVGEDVENIRLSTSVKRVRDDRGRPMALFSSAWEKGYTARQHPTVRFLDYA